MHRLADAAYRTAKPLCRNHQIIALAWRDHFYDWRNPTDWPGGCHIMDSRTSHTERAADWDRKNAREIELTATICHSGSSPQCGEAARRQQDISLTSQDRRPPIDEIGQT